MQKQILIITDNVKEQVNGVVTTFANIELHALRDGYSISYIDPSFFKSVAAPGYPEVRLAWPKKIGRIIESRQPDYIHIATEGPVGLAARLWLNKRRWKYNTSYHTKFPEFIQKIYGIPKFITYAYVRWFHKHSGRVLTTTETMVTDLTTQGFQGDIVPWTRGVDRQIFGPTLRDCTARDYKILLNVGRVSQEKGIDDFCQLQIPGIRKIIVGDGPYKAKLEKKYPTVEFVGVKTGVELATYFANADVFVFPSKNDTFGVVIIEALSCGTPVAAYPVPGPIDILETGVTGYMSTDLQDAVERCLDYSRERVVEASQKWSWENCWQIFRDNLKPVRPLT